MTGSPSSSSVLDAPGVGIETEPLRCANSTPPFSASRAPFAAFKETSRDSGAWRVRIKSRQDTSAVLYPNALRLQARAVSASGKSSFTWTDADVKRRPGAAKPLKLVVHVSNGEPAAIEVLPNAANAAVPFPVKFRWPAA